jgi:hypothetical protein
MDRLRKIPLLILVLLSLSAPINSRADTLDTLLNVLVVAGIVDPAIVDAKDLVNCLVTQPPQACVGGELQSGGFMPEDPGVRAVVEVVKAAYGSDWLKVLEVTGTDVLFQVVCKAGLSTTGPISSFVCGGLFAEVVSKGKPVVRQVLVAIGSGDFGDWVKLVTMAGPELGCSLIPDSIPGKDAVCGPLAEVLAYAVDAFNDAANAVWGGINNLGDWVSGQDTHMDRDHYYALYWQPWYHYGTWLGVANNWQGWGTLLAYVRDPCEKYFDSHTMSQENAQELCDGQRDRFSNEVKAFKSALDVAPDAYYEMAIKHLPAIYAIEDYGKLTNSTKRTFVRGLCETHMRGLFPFPEPNAARCQSLKASADKLTGSFHDMLMQLYNQCLTDQNTQQPTPSVASFVCTPLGNRFVAELDQERAKLDDKIRDLVIAGCLPPTGWSPEDGINLKCLNYPAYDQCRDVFGQVNTDNYCSLDQVKADNKLARAIRNELGLKRCGLSGDTTVVCTRPWKKERCEVLRKAAIQGLSQPSALRCELMLDSSYLSGWDKARTVVSALNTISRGDAVLPEEDDTAANKAGLSRKLQMRKKPVEMLKAEVAPTTVPVQQLMPANCAIIWDNLGIHCTDSSVVLKLRTYYPEMEALPLCQQDPNHDGSSVVCYSGTLQIPMPGSKTIVIDPQELNKFGKQDISALLPGKKPGKGQGGMGGFAPAQQEALTKSRMDSKPLLPDITSRETLTVGGTAVQWGRIHAINSNLPGCQLQLAYHVGNKGMADSPAFALKWLDMNTNQQVKLQRIYGLKKDVEYLKTERVSIHPGDNRFMLKLDSASEVSELNEGNNELLVTIRYTGRCGLTTMPPTPRIIATPPSREKATKAPVSKFAPTLKQGGFKPLSPSE